MKYQRRETKEYARTHIKGLWMAHPTPFTPDLQLDEGGLRRDLRYFLDKLDMITGMYSPGVIGEFWSLSTRERNRVLEIQVEEARGQAEVAATITASSPYEAIELARYAQDVGADYVVLSQPFLGHPRPSERAIYQFYKTVSDAIEIGMWVFNSELIAGYPLSPELMGELAKLENVAGAKDPDAAEHVAQTRRAVGTNAPTCDCNEDRWLEAHLNGQPVLVAYGPYMYQTPEWQPIAEYTRLLDQGRVEEARKVSAGLQPVRDVAAKWLGPSMQQRVMPAGVMKYWCELMGMSGGSVRPPLDPISEETKAALRADLIRVGLVKEAAATRA